MPTLAALIRDLAHLVGAVDHEGTFSAGTTTTGTDNVELNGYADDTFNDRRYYIWEGTALGQERRITDHTGATGVLTFPLGTAPGATSKYIILRDGWTVAQLRTSLIQALRSRRKLLLEPFVDESITLDNSPDMTYAYTVPAGFAAIEKIMRETDVGSGMFTTPLAPDYWYINRAATRQIVFEQVADDLSWFLVHGCKLRIVGQKYEDEPTTDAGVISVQTAALVMVGAVMAHLSRVPTDPTNARRHTADASMVLQEFQRTWAHDITPVAPGSKMVDE